MLGRSRSAGQIAGMTDPVLLDALGALPLANADPATRGDVASNRRARALEIRLCSDGRRFDQAAVVSLKTAARR